MSFRQFQRTLGVTADRDSLVRDGSGSWNEKWGVGS